MTETLFHLLWTTVWQSALLAGIVFAVIFLLGNRLQSRFRYTLWCLVLLRLLVPVTPAVSWGVFRTHETAPLISIVDRKNSIIENHFVPPPESVWTAPEKIDVAHFSAQEFEVFSSVTPLPVLRETPIAAEVKYIRTLSWKHGVLFVWAVGVLGFGLRYVFDELQLYRQSRRWCHVNDDAMLELLRQCREEVGLWRHVRFWVVPQKIGAASSGFWRASVLISRTALDMMTPQQLRLILLHELVHIKRFDPAVLRIVSLLSVIYWLNPVVWFVLSRLQRERELACDAAVLHILNKHKTATEIRANQKVYGHTVLEFATTSSSQHHVPGLVGASLDYRNKNTIARRIDMILKHKRNTILQGVLGVTLVTLFIAFGLTRAAEKTQEKPLESKIDIATNNTTPDSPVPKPDDTAEGVFVEGRVSDSDGKPIENALVVWKTSMAQQLENRKKAVKTDANGQYRSPEMEKTKGSITVIAEGFAPEMKEFEFGSDNPPVDFALKPGKKLEIHCVDADGNPIPDVEVTLGGNVLSNGNPTPDSGWKRKANIYNSKDEGIPETNIPNTTDTNGVYRWTWAPDGELLFSFRKSGYMTSFVGPEMIGQNWMTAREEPYKVVLHKNKVIKGRIIDESTGEPIEKFQVIHAWKRGNSRRIFWNALPMPKVTVSENTFQWNIIWEFERYQFRVEAYGYLPYTSDVINVDDPDVSLNIALKPDPGQVYTVLSPEGKPLDDVKVFRTVEGNYFQTIQTSHDKKLYGNDKPTYLTDEKGQFTTPVLKENFLLFLQHPQGMAWIPREKLPQDRVIRLQRGVQVRIKTVRDTPLKLSNEIYLDLANDPMGYISYQYSIPEDDTVVIDNVMPGNYRVLQRYDYPGRHEENGTLGFVAFDIPVKIEPEKTNTLDMNLQGETVSGTVVMPDGVWRFRNVETWEYPQVSLESVESKDGRPTLLTTRIVPSEKYRDVGEFTFKNVPAGEYKFDASIRWRPDNESWGALSKIAQWDTKIKMGDVPIKLDVVLALTMTGDFIFNGEHWINNTMGDSMPLPKDSKGFLVQGESGMLRLNAKNGQGSVELINGNGTAGYGEYIKITNGGNAIQVGGPGHKVKTLLK